MESLNIKNVLKFVEMVTRLKHISRKGWEYCNIDKHEQIAGHMYAMAMMTFLIPKDSTLDRFKCLQMAVVHDLAECIVGDITPKDNIDVDVKHKLEDNAMQEITKLLGTELGNVIYNLYKEYENKSTPEAKFVKDLDRFDMIFTASSYEKRDKTPNKLQEFFDCTEGKFEHPLIKKMVEELLQDRSTSTE